MTKETWSCSRLSPLERAAPEQGCPRATEGGRSCPELTHSFREQVLHVLKLLSEPWIQCSWKGFQGSKAVLQELCSSRDHSAARAVQAVVNRMVGTGVWDWQRWPLEISSVLHEDFFQEKGVPRK